jgi:phage FluMu protein Com
MWPWNHKRNQWRCLCGKLLGKYLGNNLVHVRHPSGAEVIAPMPMIVKCHKCKRVNVTTGPEESMSHT